MNRKGFTLVELLGVIVILSIVMVIALPNVMSVFENNKRQTYLSDAEKLVSQAKYELRSGKIFKPGEKEVLKITLKYLGTADVSKDSDGNKYDLENSYVVVFRKDETLRYYVNLVAGMEENHNRGIRLVNSDELSGDDKLKLVITDMNVPSDQEILEIVNIPSGGTITTY